MRDVRRATIAVAAVFGLISTHVMQAKAAGALAVGACAAYGYAYDYPSSDAAQAAAIEKCGDTCKKVVATNKGCVALAVDGHKPCGPNGYATCAQARRGAKHSAAALLQIRWQGLRDPGLDLRRQEELTPAGAGSAAEAIPAF